MVITSSSEDVMSTGEISQLIGVTLRQITIELDWYKLKPWIKFSLFLSRYRLCGRRMIWSSRTLVYLFEEHDYFSTRMNTRERAGDALLRTMLVKSIPTVATLIDVNLHVITKARFPLVIKIVIIGDSYDFPILRFLRLLRFLGQPGSNSS